MKEVLAELKQFGEVAENAAKDLLAHHAQDGSKYVRAGSGAH